MQTGLGVVGDQGANVVGAGIVFFCPANACRNDVTLGLALIKDNSIIILVSKWHQSGDYPMLVEIRPT